MIFLLELKENIKRFFNKYDIYIIPTAKFILAFISFMILNASIGYMTKLSNPVIALLLSLACAFAPSGFTVFILSVYMLIHLYAISAEFYCLCTCYISGSHLSRDICFLSLRLCAGLVYLM